MSASESLAVIEHLPPPLPPRWVQAVPGPWSRPACLKSRQGHHYCHFFIPAVGIAMPLPPCGGLGGGGTGFFCLLGKRLPALPQTACRGCSHTKMETREN